MKKTLLAIGLNTFALFAMAQTDTTKTATVTDTTNSAALADLDLASLMDVKVVSASKKAESLFDAPVSIGSLSKEEIKRAGATSIMEALRLMPGLIVKEQTNGNYEVAIRGLENIPSNSSLNQLGNSITLVMIDNRPVYNYFNGGTFWETLPVDLNDIEKIEVVRGPSSALYGPNAASGVINIITRKVAKDGFYAVANAQGGIPNQVVSNASVGYRKGKFDFIISGNQQYRERTENQYYNWSKGKKVDLDSVVTYFPANRPLLDNNQQPNSQERYPDPKLALNKIGYNGFLNYYLNEKSTISLSLGGQKSTAQRAFTENLATPLGVTESNSQYADLRAKINNLSAQVSYLGGTQNISRGVKGYQYDFNTLDAFVEYDIAVGGFSIKPGVNYRNAIYNDSKYADISKSQGFLNGSKSLSNVAGSLRGEYNLKDKLKLVAALRVDKYNNLSKVYFSYQFAATYKINESNLIRASYSKAYRGPTMYDSYSSNSLYLGNFPLQTPAGPVLLPGYATLQGNPNLNLLGVEAFELGYRVKPIDKLAFDLDLFYQTSDNYNMTVNQRSAPRPDFSGINVPQSVENISVRANQYGLTLAANYVLNSKLQFKPFVTVQQTTYTQMPLFRNSVAADTVNNLTKTSNGYLNGTPSVYGGAYINYQITPKFNINLNGYYFSNYAVTNLYNGFSNNGGTANVAGKLILNAKVGYKIIKPLEVFINVRNFTNNTGQEYVNTDATRATFLLGLSLDLQ